VLSTDTDSTSAVCEAPLPTSAEAVDQQETVDQQQQTLFEHLLPLPKRVRPTTVRNRKKPPSYELTSCETLAFVPEATERKLKRKDSKVKKGSKVLSSAESIPHMPSQEKGAKEKSQASKRPKSRSVQDMSDGKRRKNQKNREDKGVCAHCGYGYGNTDDPHIEDDWCQCTVCHDWCLWF